MYINLMIKIKFYCKKKKVDDNLIDNNIIENNNLINSNVVGDGDRNNGVLNVEENSNLLVDDNININK